MKLTKTDWYILSAVAFYQAVFVLFLLFSSQEANAEEWLVIQCGFDRIEIRASDYPRGVAMSKDQLCDCLRRRSERGECSLRKAQASFYEQQQKMTEDLINSIEPSTVRTSK